MKALAIALIALLFVEAAYANAGSTSRIGWRMADAASACLVNCATQNDSCKRMCPATYNGPCMSACDNQAQFCRQACQQK
jgi:hypothetical protein